MPAKTVVFNAKAEVTHTFPLAMRNTVLYSPHGRFVLVAGFGNLAGQVDIYDLEKDYAKICTIEASNASVCEWSPDGKYILTATTSPRLRVDNGIRIWHAGGPLMYNQDMNELYHVCWRPQPTSAHPLEANPLLQIPAPHESATQYLGTKKTPSKPAGAYRPPGARGQITPLAFRREDEGGAAYIRDGISSFSNNINGFGKPRARVVPGAEPVDDSPLPPGAAPGGGVSLTGTGEGKDGEVMSKAAKKNAKKREAKKAAAAAAAATAETGSAALAPDAGGVPVSKSPSRSPERRQQARGHERNRSRGYVPATPPGLEPPQHKEGQKRERSRSGSRRQRGDTHSSISQPTHIYQNGAPKGPAPNTPSQKAKSAPSPINTGAPLPPPIPMADPPELEVTSPVTPGGNPQEKKIRGLLKKIRAIEDLKMRHASGEKLEGTQLQKITSEDSVRKELAALGYNH